jgi:AraC-like DNA-binding protein
MQKAPAISELFAVQGQHELLSPFPHIHMVGIHRYKKASRTLRMHHNPGIEICYSFNGRFEWNVEGTNVTLNKGESSITCPWQRHGGKYDVMAAGMLGWIIISPGRMSRDGDFVLGKWAAMAGDEQRSIGRLITGNRTPSLGHAPVYEHLFRELALELQQRQIGYVHTVNGCVGKMLVEAARIIRQPSRPGPRVPAGVERALRALMADPSRHWTMADLTGLSGLQETAFTQWVKKKTGFPPLKYLLTLRLDMARRMLLESTTSITAIALDLGFASSQHFASAFSGHTGMSPSHYRRIGR